MDQDQDRVYRTCLKFVRILLKVIGAWPKENNTLELCVRYFLMVVYLTTGVTMCAKAIVWRHDTDVLMDTLPYIFTFQALYTKWFNNWLFNAKKMSTLFDLTEEDWQEKRSSEESDIMLKYAKKGKFFMIIYAGNIYVFSTLYAIMSVLPLVLDALIPLNETRPRVYYYMAEYFIDEDRYFTYITIHMVLVGTISMTAVVAMDVMFILYVSHACGLFAVSGYRLSEATKYSLHLEQKGRSLELENIVYQKMVHGIRGHQRALKYAALIESAYYATFFVVIGDVIAVLTLTLVIIQQRVFSGRVDEAGRHVAFVVGQMFHLFYMSFPGQMLSDHSADILTHSYESPWYNVTPNTQKLVILIMRKSQNVCVLTAGGLYSLLLENFAMVVQTSMSYFTVLSSMG